MKRPLSYTLPILLIALALPAVRSVSDAASRHDAIARLALAPEIVVAPLPAPRHDRLGSGRILRP